MFRVGDCVQHHQKAHVGIADRSDLPRAKVVSDSLKIVDIVLDGFSRRVMDGIGFSTSASVVKNQTTALCKLPEGMNEEQIVRDLLSRNKRDGRSMATSPMVGQYREEA